MKLKAMEETHFLCGQALGGALTFGKGVLRTEFCYSVSAMRETGTGIAAFSWMRPAGESGRAWALKGVILAAAFMSLARLRASAAAPAGKSWSLTNGIRVVSVYFPNSTNISIFTYSPMGLASDGPKQAQWAHLVEHLVIRSTVPDDSSTANAETLPEHMRLDFYGNISNWKE